jgi:tetratricopeptide (TPR) repeat protein
VERFKTLPLGNGRAENTVAYWYAQRGEFAEAKRWLKQALIADPTNNRAFDLYGRIAFEERQPRRALEAYLIALSLRPDKAQYRGQLALAVAGVGGPETGLGMVDTMIAMHPDNAMLWLERGMLLRAARRDGEAAEAKARALRLLPALAFMVDTLPHLTR